jgi:hypothetical protein
MTDKKQRLTLVGLRLTLAIVVLAQAIAFLYSSPASSAHAGYALPHALRLALGWSEVIGAILFLLPPTFVIGGWLLIAVFSGAMFVHLAHGQFAVGALLVYGAAVGVVLAHRQRRMQIERGLS